MTTTSTTTSTSVTGVATDVAGPGGPPFRAAIDVHHHAVPDFYRRALLEGGVDSPLAGVEFPPWDVEASLGAMEREGIATAMLSLSVPGVATPDRGLARRLAREVNEYFAELIARFPGRFGAFAVVPLPEVDAALEEVAYALDVLGLDGVGLFTNYGRTYLADPAFEPLVGELARRRAVAFVHPAGPPPEDQPAVDLPGSVCEFPFATTRMVAHMLYNGTLERHPELRLIIPHAGGALPYLATRMTFAPVIRPSMADRAPADPIDVLRGLYLDIAMSGNPITLPSLRAFADPGRVLVGTDFPFMPEWSSTENGHQFVGSGCFDTDELAAVERTTAEGLFPRLRR